MKKSHKIPPSQSVLVMSLVRYVALYKAPYLHTRHTHFAVSTTSQVRPGGLTVVLKLMNVN